MLYHLVGMSFSDSTNFVCDLSAMADLPRRKVGPKLRALSDGVNTRAAAGHPPQERSVRSCYPLGFAHQRSGPPAIVRPCDLCYGHTNSCVYATPTSGKTVA